MLINTTSQVIRAKIEGAPTTSQPTFSTTFADITATTFVASESTGTLTGTTPATVVASPAASTARHIKEIQIFNADTVDHTITVDLYDGATSYVFGAFYVPAGLFLRYGQENGWQIGVGVGVGVGTVTSVGLTGSPIFSISGSPITSFGTLDIELANQADNTLFANISGSPAAPAFSTLSAILDHAVGNSRGSLITRTAVGWVLLPPGATPGNVLSTNGAGADLSYIAPAATGVTSVAMTGDGVIFNATVPGSPITSSGTLAPALLNQTANKVLAGPSTGSPAAPTFRSLVAADIPALSYVTSVGLSLPAEFTVSGSPVTSTGNLTAVWANETANFVFAGPATGSPGTPGFRALVAADIPSLSATYVRLDGSNTPMTGALSLAAGAAATPSLNFASATTTGLFSDTTNSGLGVSVGANQVAFFAGGGSGAAANMSVISDGNIANNQTQSFNATANSGSVYTMRRARGSVATPAVAALNDVIGNIQWQPYRAGTGTGYTNAARIQGLFIETGTVDATHVGMRIAFFAAPIGSGTLTEIMRLEALTGLSMFGANVVIDANRNWRGAALAPGKIRVIPVTGFSATIANGIGTYYMKPAGTLATGTLTMPATPVDGQYVTISSTQIITTFTLSPNSGQSVNNAPVTFAANTSIQFFYDATDSAWVRVF